MALRALISLARRRLFCNGLLAEGVRAASITLGAFILLLVAGTGLLQWQWLVPVPIAAAVWGFYLAWRRRPSAYRTARTIDERLTLSDALSTALHFSQPEHIPVSEELRQLQFDQAERLAVAADVRSAVPWVVPRSIYLLLALVAVASGLFALRYGLSRGLDLKPPLARMIAQELGIDTAPRQTARGGRPNRAAAPEPDAPADADPSGDQTDGAQEANIDDEIAQALGNHPDSKPGDSGKQQGSTRNTGDKGEDSQKGASDQNANAANQSADASQKGDPKAGEGQKRESKENAGADGESSSLMSKVKDAFENLLSKMKPQQGNPGSQEQGSREQAGQKAAKGQSAKSQSAQNAKPSGDPQGDAEDSQSTEKSQNAPDPSGKGSGKSEASQASKQPGSGVGSQEGDKSIKQAEQTAAMGKISEIIGKRSANLTGETTVEVKSTTQQLRTQYAQRSAQHSQTGSEISRDDIPVALQNYVSQYFEAVRKQAPPAGTGKNQ